jgi:hypothetical protein
MSDNQDQQLQYLQKLTEKYSEVCTIVSAMAKDGGTGID